MNDEQLKIVKKTFRSLNQITFVVVIIHMVILFINSFHESNLGFSIITFLCGVLAILSALNIQNPYKDTPKLIIYSSYILALLWVILMMMNGLEIFR